MILKSPTNKTKIRNRSVSTKEIVQPQEWTMTDSGEWLSQTPTRRCATPEFISKLGHGRAAEVHLVKDPITGEHRAEKLFKSKRSASELGRDIIYFTCFQAPFPYHTKENAIRAAMFRRKVLRNLTEYWFGEPLVADASYTRWDENELGYVLGTEYIPGKGPKPGQYDPHVARKLFLNYPVRFIKRLFGVKSPRIEGNYWEIDDVTAQLDKLKERFHEAGLVGSEWQVNKILSTPTSNLLKDEDGRWVLVDVESGMPALILLKSLLTAIRLGTFPLFDDVDFSKLRDYLSANYNGIIESLGEERTKKLFVYVDELEYHTRAWKASEPAIFSHKHHLLTSSKLRANIRKGFAEHWQRSGNISAEKAARIEKSSFQFLSYSIIDAYKNACFGIKTLFRSLLNFGTSLAQGIGTSLRLVYSALFNEAYLKQFSEYLVNENIDSWQKAGRLTAEEAKALRPDMETPAQVEYINGLGFHIGLKPVITLIILAYGTYVLHDPELMGVIQVILASIWVGPATRTLYTLYRMIRTRGKGLSHSTALFVGILPKVGNAAYPIQMTTTHPNLSSFLLRSVFSIFGCHFPLFGGTDSRLEHSFIKVADFGASILYEFANAVSTLKSLVWPGRYSKRESKAEQI